MTQIHTPRMEERTLTLESCFNLSLMKKAWQRFVKDGMRSQDLLDLHDYYDFHRNRSHILNIVRTQILEGRYNPKSSLVIRTEKKLGVCRHLQIPSPEDAVVLQTLVENLSPIIKEAQPSQRAFYSRSHGGPRSETEIDETFPYAWWELWPIFQTRIYEFSSVFDHVVVTDVANYYDNIFFRQLRNRLTSYGKINECLLDFLFYMLESLVWRPDYLPLSGVGLPQINFDAPRLLGHAFLFEVDSYLNEKTGGNFVRWMDDIDFGVNDTEQAKEILRGLDELLLTRGLRLNLGKTKVLSYEEAEEYFLPNENRFLTIMTNRIKRKIALDETIDDDKKWIRKRFKGFLRMPKVGRWEKVYSRYFSLGSITRDSYLEKYVPLLLNNNPGMRISILRYYSKLGPSKNRFKQLKEYYLSKHCTDDTTIFSVAKTLIDWHILPGSAMRREIVDLARNTAGCSETNLVSSIWLLAKYGTEPQLAAVIGTHSEKWKHSSFASRQVAATAPRLRKLAGQYRYVERTLNETGQLDALRVLYHFNELRLLQPLPSAEKLYILHGTHPVTTYPLSKYLIAIDLLTCEQVPVGVRRNLRNEIIQRIPDPLYKKELLEINI